MSDLLSDQIHHPDGPVLVIGAASVDMVGRVLEDIRLGTSSPAAIRTSFGGVARNVAENLARLGQSVRLLTATGADGPGQSLVQQAREAGVDTTHILTLDEEPTSTYLGVINPQGELQFALDDMRAIQAVSPEYLQQHATLFEDASLLFLDANLSKATLKTAIELAKQANLPVCADPTSATLAHRLLPYLPDLLLVTPNNFEAAILGKQKNPPTFGPAAIETAKHLVARGADIVILSLAEFGVCYATSETSGQIPAMRSEIVDPTGAGDALTAAVLFALLNNIPLDDAVRLGVSAATLTLRYAGTVLPDLSLEKLYDQLVI